MLHSQTPRAKKNHGIVPCLKVALCAELHQGPIGRDTGGFGLPTTAKQHPYRWIPSNRPRIDRSENSRVVSSNRAGVLSWRWAVNGPA